MRRISQWLSIANEKCKLPLLGTFGLTLFQKSTRANHFRPFSIFFVLSTIQDHFQSQTCGIETQSLHNLRKSLAWHGFCNSSAALSKASKIWSDGHQMDNRYIMYVLVYDTFEPWGPQNNDPELAEVQKCCCFSSFYGLQKSAWNAFRRQQAPLAVDEEWWWSIHISAMTR